MIRITKENYKRDNLYTLRTDRPLLIKRGHIRIFDGCQFGFRRNAIRAWVEARRMDYKKYDIGCGE